MTSWAASRMAQPLRLQLPLRAPGIVPHHLAEPEGPRAPARCALFDQLLVLGADAGRGICGTPRRR